MHANLKYLINLTLLIFSTLQQDHITEDYINGSYITVDNHMKREVYMNRLYIINNIIII